MFRRGLLIAVALVAVYVSTGCRPAAAGGSAAGGSTEGLGSSGHLPGGAAPGPVPAPGGAADRGGPPAPVAPDGLLQVERIDVRVLGPPPAQVQVRVQGMLLDGCTSLGPVSQRRRGNAVTVTIATVNSGAPVCTGLAQLVDTTIRLDGAFPSGTYRVRVNGVERGFRIG